MIAHSQGTGISLWRYLAQNQVHSQTHAESVLFVYPCLLIPSYPTDNYQPQSARALKAAQLLQPFGQNV